MTTGIQPVFGLEFEVSFSALDGRGHRVSPGTILHHFMSVATSSLTFLPARASSGIFLGNGARLYLDCGKPEITTPEVLSPADACRYARAGEGILLDISRGVVQECPQVAEVVLTRGNVSYGGRSNSWACHESYGHRCESNLADDFIPHAVSRIIFTGAGGFDNRSHGIQFLLSPRVTHIRAAISENTQRYRGIYNTKDESLCGNGYRRLHVICGENVSSILSQWLKMATTAVVVAMTEAGLRPGHRLALRQPVKAMRTFAEDTTLTATAATTSGEHLTAIEMQRRLLEKARRLTVDGSAEVWLPVCLRLWSDTLDRLERGLESVQRSLDWAIKLDLFRNYAQRRGIPWERLMRWNQVLRQLDEVPSAPSEYSEMFSEFTSSRLPDEARKVRPAAKREGLDWDELERVLAVRQELFEIDTRFGQLGERGVFESLDRGGHLDHQVPGVDDIGRAKTEPPSEGRAGLRGRMIRKLAAEAVSAACEWSGVWDFHNRRCLDLSDPLEEREDWKSFDEFPYTTPDNPADRVSLSFYDAVRKYAQGRYEMSHRLLIMVRDWSATLRVPIQSEVSRFTAWVQARRGFTNGAALLDAVHRQPITDIAAVRDYLLVYRFQGLAPAAAMRQWCERGRAMLAQEASPDPDSATIILACHAYQLLCDGRPVEAWNAYHDVPREAWIHSVLPRGHARILTEKADVLRRLGRTSEAASQLDAAEAMQVDNHFDGDLTDLTRTQRAKLAIVAGDLATAESILTEARRIQSELANFIGEARSILLLARLNEKRRRGRRSFVGDAARTRLEQIRTHRPALAECRLLSKILQHWDAWVQGRNVDGEEDFFWGL